MSQIEHSRANREAWSHRAYEAWERGYGTPTEAAAGIGKDPETILREYRQYLGNLEGKTVANLLGSHGRRAVALALLGADVTVVDISEENQQYALEVAENAGVTINYVVADVLEWGNSPPLEHFDLVLMEYGILHYFVDLNPLARIVNSILRPGGTAVLHEFHPIIKKCMPMLEARKLVLEGDYFSRETREGPAPFSGSLPDEDADSLPLCCLRYWTLGEVVTAIACSGLTIECLVEKPHTDHPTLPGKFTLVARRLP